MTMVYYKPVKITINAPGLVKIIVDVIVQYHSISNSIVIDEGLLFILKFWLSLCHFFGIKQRFSITFHLQTDGISERQNNTMEIYLRAFDNFKQNNLVKLLPMAEFAYNNAKNTSTGYTLFKLNYGYQPCISFEKDTNPHSQSKTSDKLSTELSELMIVC